MACAACMARRERMLKWAAIAKERAENVFRRSKQSAIANGEHGKHDGSNDENDRRKSAPSDRGG